jgi:glycosyltransferase involved in cell wall biosynthesis
MVSRVRPRPLLSRPSVSVVIPCYNYGRFLPDCVGSVLAQADVDIDVVIVDDASPDGSFTVARELAAADPRVRAIAHAINQGHIATYNEGLSAVDGEYVVLLSADDLLAPGSLARSVALLEAHPEVGMVYGYSPWFNETPPPAKTKVRSWSIWDGEEWIDQVCRGVTNPVSTPDVVMRAKLMRDLAGYDSRAPHAADLLLWLRAASRAAVGRINGADQAFYRAHGENMHKQQFGGAYRDIVERQHAFEMFFDDERAHLREAERLRDTARRALAREALTMACRSDELARYRNEPVDKLVAFARETSPPSESRQLWLRYERLAGRPKGGPSAKVRRYATVAADDVHGRVRWRKWRRSGMFSAVKSI